MISLMSLMETAIMVILAIFILPAFYCGDFRFVVEICMISLILWFALYGI